jgi:hypothetical protein
MTGCLAHYLTDWTDWLTGLAASLTDWLTDWLTEWLPGWLTNLLTDWLTNWLTDWPTDWLTGWLAGLTDRMTDWLTDRLTDWLTDWLSGAKSFGRWQLLSWTRNSHHLWNLKAHHRVHKSSPLDPVLSQFNSAPNSLKSTLILSYGEVSHHFSSGFPTRILYNFVISPWGRRVKLTTQLHLVQRSKNEWRYTSTPPTCLHGVLLS